jgi:hypothetical protein
MGMPLVKQCKLYVAGETVDQKCHGDSRHTNTVFKHIYVAQFVKQELFFNGFQKRNDVSIVIPNEKITKRFHVVTAPNLFAISVILIGNIFVFKFAVKSFLRRKRFAGELT